MIFLKRALSLEQSSSDAIDDLDEIARLYLQFSFDALPSELRGKDETVESASADSQFAAVPALRKKLEQSLLCVADNLLNCYSPDVSGSWEVCVSVSYLSVWSSQQPNEMCSLLPSAVPVYPSRVPGAVFQSADWCFSRLHLRWVSE